MKQIIKDIEFEKGEDEILEVSEYEPNCRDVLVWINGSEICLLTSSDFGSEIYKWRSLFNSFIEGNGYSGQNDCFGDIREAMNFALDFSEDSEVISVDSPEELAELLDELY